MMLQLKTAIMDRDPGNNFSNNQKYSIFHTSIPSPIGRLYIASFNNLICNITIGKFAKKRFEQYFSSYPFLDLKYSSSKLKKNTINILRYFKSGKSIPINSVIILKATDFQLSVWEKTAQIPFGETRSYQWIAKEINKPHSSRAVGNALGKNPIPLIIPCHRVIKSNGERGGFTGGEKIKKHLLSVERSMIVKKL